MSDTTENNEQSDAAGPASPPPPAQSVAESADSPAPAAEHTAAPEPAPAPDTAVAPEPEGRWDARKTAIVAALAIVLCSAGAIGAAAALPREQGTGDFGGGPGRVFIPQNQFAP